MRLYSSDSESDFAGSGPRGPYLVTPKGDTRDSETGVITADCGIFTTLRYVAK
jgi:hypothetical protein